MLNSQIPKITSSGDAAAWIREILCNGPMLVNNLKREAVKSGYSWRTIERARVKAGAESKRGGFGKPAIWHLMSESTLSTLAPVAPNNLCGVTGVTGVNGEPLSSNESVWNGQNGHSLQMPKASLPVPPALTLPVQSAPTSPEEPPSIFPRELDR